MNKLDILQWAIIAVLWIWFLRVIWCKRADRKALEAQKRRCEHGVAWPIKCGTCTAALEEFFNKPDPSKPNPWRLPTQEELVAHDGVNHIFHQDPKIWTTRDGREMRISTMSTDHIVNAARLLVRRYNSNPRFAPLSKIVPQYSELYDEARRRGVEYLITQ